MPFQNEKPSCFIAADFDKRENLRKWGEALLRGGETP
jgi:hypothetical protein